MLSVVHRENLWESEMVVGAARVCGPPTGGRRCIMVLNRYPPSDLSLVKSLAIYSDFHAKSSDFLAIESLSDLQHNKRFINTSLGNR